MNSPVPARSEIWKTWLAAMLWLGLIVFESSNALSSANTSRFLYPLFHFLLGLDLIHFLTWHFFLRKAGHVIGYAVLSLLFYRAWRVTVQISGNPRWSIVWARIAFTMTTLVASLDEWHQTFLPSRTGTVHDVLLDSTAAFAAQILVYMWIRLRSRPKRASQEPSSTIITDNVTSAE